MVITEKEHIEGFEIVSPTIIMSKTVDALKCKLSGMRKSLSFYVIIINILQSQLYDPVRMKTR